MYQLSAWRAAFRNVFAEYDWLAVLTLHLPSQRKLLRQGGPVPRCRYPGSSSAPSYHLSTLTVPLILPWSMGNYRVEYKPQSRPGRWDTPVTWPCVILERSLPFVIYAYASIGRRRRIIKVVMRICVTQPMSQVPLCPL